MILSDFLTLEVYFSGEEAACFFEDASKKYGAKPLQACIEAGDLICRAVRMGPDAGRLVVWLSDKGRTKAASH